MDKLNGRFMRTGRPCRCKGCGAEIDAKGKRIWVESPRGVYCEQCADSDPSAPTGLREIFQRLESQQTQLDNLQAQIARLSGVKAPSPTVKSEPAKRNWKDGKIADTNETHYLIVFPDDSKDTILRSEYDTLINVSTSAEF